jgi:hypothetical protein
MTKIEQTIEQMIDALEGLCNEASSHNNNPYCELDAIDTDASDKAIKAGRALLEELKGQEPVA